VLVLDIKTCGIKKWNEIVATTVDVNAVTTVTNAVINQDSLN